MVVGKLRSQQVSLELVLKLEMVCWDVTLTLFIPTYFYNLFILCGVINDPMYIFEDLPI